MTLEDIKNIDSNIRNSFLVKPHLYLFGGEPLINQDFREIFAYLSGQKYRMSICTNGTGLESLVDLIAIDRRVRNLIVSLHRENIEQVRNVIDLFERIKKENISISLNCPVDMLRETKRKFSDVIRMFEGTCADYLTFQHSQTVFLDKGYSIDDEFIEEIKKVTKKKWRIPIFFFPNIKEKDLAAYYRDPNFPNRSKKCILPWLDMVIHPDGNVVPCDELDHIVGNVNREKLDDIWNKEIYRVFRRDIHRNGLSCDICIRCCHRQYS